MQDPVTEVRFFHNASEKLEAACRITASAWRQGRRVTVLAPESGQAQRFDQHLWTWQALSFVPHVAADSPLAAETPVLVARDLAANSQYDVLVNLGNVIPDGFERFAQVIEIVSLDDADRAQARARWAHYKSCGIKLQSNDLAAREQA